MPDQTWTGGTSDALDLAANWSGAALPGDGDAAFFPKDATQGPATNMTGLADTLSLIHVAAGASYNIGSSGSEMKVKATKVVNNGRGEFWYDVDSMASDSNIILAPASGGSSNLLLSTSADLAQVYCLAGAVSITGVGATDLIVVGSLGTNEASVTIGSGVGTTLNLVQFAGACFSNNLITRLDLSGGRHEKLSTPAATTVVQRGGIMMYDATDTVLRYEGLAGSLDFTRMGRALTVTTFVESPNLTMLRSTDLTTFTNHIDIAGVL